MRIYFVPTSTQSPYSRQCFSHHVWKIVQFNRATKTIAKSDWYAIQYALVKIPDKTIYQKSLQSATITSKQITSDKNKTQKKKQLNRHFRFWLEHSYSPTTAHALTNSFQYNEQQSTRLLDICFFFHVSSDWIYFTGNWFNVFFRCCRKSKIINNNWWRKKILAQTTPTKSSFVCIYSSVLSHMKSNSGE